MSLTLEDKEEINLRIEHYLIPAIEKALERHVFACPVAFKIKVMKWSFISLLVGIGIAGGNFGLKEIMKLLGV